MIPLTILVPDIEDQVEGAFAGDERDMHLYCCSPDVALCGVDLSHGEDGEDTDPIDCIRCEVIHEAGLPCGAPFCRLRSAWRWWRSR